MKVALTTIGCRFNQFETAEMEELFRAKNFEIVPFQAEANIYVINTCTVTKRSNYRCRQIIRRVIQNNKNSFVIVTGCYSQITPDEISFIKGVDMILGNTEKLNILKHLDNLNLFNNGRNSIEKLRRPQIIVKDVNISKEFKSSRVLNFSGRTSAYLKIQTGCNQICSFCIVVIARGPAISEKPETILKQAEGLAGVGFKEIVLTGVNLGSYGIDLYPPAKLSALIELLTDVKGIERIRLSSINPKEIDDGLISAIKKSGKVCRHFHIPLQSGDDEILKMMRRNYTSSIYRELILKLKDEMPDAGIGADVVVGFPGEDEKKFENTYRLVDELPLSYLHVFSYSPRYGTDAYIYEGETSEFIKKKRNQIMKELGRSKSNIFRQDFLERTCRVLIENTRDKETGLLRGYTDNYIPVMINDEDRLMNRMVNVRITDVSDNAVMGKVVDEIK